MRVAAQRHEPLLSQERRIFDGEDKLIFQGNRRVGKVNAVFLPVRPGLGAILLHSHVHQDMYIRTSCQGRLQVPAGMVFNEPAGGEGGHRASCSVRRHISSSGGSPRSLAVLWKRAVMGASRSHRGASIMPLSGMVQ